MAGAPLSPLDFHLLHYFSVVADAGSFQQAAKILCMSQPPLSRQIKRLEEKLGFELFRRHSRGLELTGEGRRALEIIQPLLAAHATASAALAGIGPGLKTSLAIGLTTAFEQGAFAKIRQILAQSGRQIQFSLKSSPRLVRDAQNGLLDFAFVAMPLDAPGLMALPAHYSEPLMAVLPAAWPEAQKPQLRLAELSGRPLFWFRREMNPAYFDHMRRIFRHLGFAPAYVEEPPEHDVLLAAIAQGAGMALLPASFAAIRRDNVAFAPLAGENSPRLELGIVCGEGNQAAMDCLRACGFASF